MPHLKIFGVSLTPHCVALGVLCALNVADVGLIVPNLCSLCYEQFKVSSALSYEEYNYP